MPIGPNVQIEIAGQGGFFPMQQSVSGSSGYPLSEPVKGATVPYWSANSGVPTFVAPLGSLYTDIASTKAGQPIFYIRIAAIIGSSLGAVWHVII